VLTATLRKGHRDLPVFFDELNDVHDAEEYGRIAGAMRALLARHDGKDEAELYPLAQTR
jgi:threonyl-tRNA synthetase